MLGKEADGPHSDMGDQMEFQDLPCPALALAGIWRVNQYMEDSSLSLSYKNEKNQTKSLCVAHVDPT